MTEKRRAFIRRNLTPARRLDIQVMLVILLCLATISVMNSYMDQGRPADGAGQSPQQSETVSAPESTPPNADPSLADPAADGIIRFHIIANSDSTQDQDLKLEVRNQVLSRIQVLLAEEMSREMARTGETELTESRRLELTRTILTEHLSQIEAWAGETVAAEGFSYPVAGQLGIRWIPDRQYDGLYFPAGNYEALTLTIGSGTGQNWWCVIYPPLCLIDSSQELQEELGEARFQAWLESLGGGRIVLKSRIAELLQSRPPKR